MNISDALARCRAIDTTVEAKGYNRHDTCTFSINWLSYKPFSIRMDFRDSSDTRRDFSASGPDYEAVFADLEAQIAAFPNRKQQLAQEFVGRLARLTEDARELEVPIAIDLDAMLDVCRTTLLEAQ